MAPSREEEGLPKDTRQLAGARPAVGTVGRQSVTSLDPGYVPPAVGPRPRELGASTSPQAQASTLTSSRPASEGAPCKGAGPWAAGSPGAPSREQATPGFLRRWVQGAWGKAVKQAA